MRLGTKKTLNLRRPTRVRLQRGRGVQMSAVKGDVPAMHHSREAGARLAEGYRCRAANAALRRGRISGLDYLGRRTATHQPLTCFW